LDRDTTGCERIRGDGNLDYDYDYDNDAKATP